MKTGSVPIRAKMFLFCAFTALLFVGFQAPAVYAQDESRDFGLMIQPPADTPVEFLSRYYFLINGKKPICTDVTAVPPVQIKEKQYRKQADALKSITKKLEETKKMLTLADQQKLSEALLKAGFPDAAAAQAQVVAWETEVAAGTQKLQTCVDEFWFARDIDPMTPENEYKKEVDERIDDVVNEVIANEFSYERNSNRTFFSSNGGYFGDMAKVYILHGMPDMIRMRENNAYFVDMMLWLYLDDNGRNHKFRFLFYKKLMGPEYRLFPRQNSMHIEYALSEISNQPSTSMGGGNQWTTELEMIYRELAYGGEGDGLLFLMALIEFSDSGYYLGQALEAPKPISEIAQKSGARVLTVVKKPKKIRQSVCDVCLTGIPAVLNVSAGTIAFRRNDIDWVVEENGYRATLDLTIYARNPDTGELVVLPKTFRLTTNDEKLNNSGDEPLVISFFAPGDLEKLAGRRHVMVYLGNLFTGKYQAWDETVTFIPAEVK